MVTDIDKFLFEQNSLAAFSFCCAVPLYSFVEFGAEASIS